MAESRNVACGPAGNLSRAGLVVALIAGFTGQVRAGWVRDDLPSIPAGYGAPTRLAIGTARNDGISRLYLPQGFEYADGSASLTPAWSASGGTGFVLTPGRGDGIVGANQAGLLLPSGVDFLDLRVYSQQAPTGASLIVNPFLNGVAIVSAVNRPTVAAAANASNIVTVFSTAGGNPLTGRIDNLQIRNVAMTAAEIAAEFQRLTRVMLVG